MLTLSQRRQLSAFPRRDRKGSVLPPRQPATRPGARGHKTQDDLQAISLTDWLPAWLFGNPRAPPGGHTLLSEMGGEVYGLHSPQASRSSFWMEASGRQAASPSSQELQTTSCWFNHSNGPSCFEEAQTPSYVYSSQLLRFTGPQAFPPAASLSAAYNQPPGVGEAGVIKSLMLQMEKLRLKGAEIHPTSQNNQGQSWGSN